MSKEIFRFKESFDNKKEELLLGLRKIFLNEKEGDMIISDHFESLPVFQRENYIYKGEYPIVDKKSNLVLLPDIGHEFLISILDMYHRGKRIEDISSIMSGYESQFADDFLENFGYYKSSRGKWYITRSLEEKLDNVDKNILGDSLKNEDDIHFLNF